MTAERWQQVKELFNAACEHASAERAAFLEVACAGDVALRQEVESLLAAHQGSGQFMRRPLVAASQPGAKPTAELLTGRTLGPYRIERQLGRGGMGVVYLAHDTRLGRPVALKLLLDRFTQDPERVRRFQREARAASCLNHPNILTIYEIGQAAAADGGAHFIAAEFVAGETLRERLHGGGLQLGAALDWALQVGSALAAAHGAGIVHRDIKPENLMVRPDGLAKVLDFGLAKLSRSTSDPYQTAVSFTGGETRPGVVLGTVNYMSPEQARGEQVDARADIFALGVVLYEMVTGRRPFDGPSTSHVLVAIQEQEPASLTRYVPHLPAELQRIVARALAKPMAERYQTASELLDDLKRLNEELAFAAKLKRAAGDEAPLAPPVGAAATADQPTVATVEAAAHPTARRAARLGSLRGRGLAVALTLAAIVIAATAFFWFKRAPVLTERDTVLLADFVNTTGDAVFDGALKQALAVQLEQSPFLNIYSDERVRETLRLMGRSPDERVTRDVAREICQRQGLKAMLIGSIASLGRNYVLALEAISAQTGDVLARQQAEAESKEQVLRTLGEAARQLRGKLGESLRSIEKFDAPIEQATTPSLEALKAFSLGYEQIFKGKSFEAMPFLKRAAELDPDFALAYVGLAVMHGNTGQVDMANEFAQKAFELRARASEREKFNIIACYHLYATGDLEKSVEEQELLKRTYPRQVGVSNNLAMSYRLLGQSDKALEESREAVRLDPTMAFAHANLAYALINLNRFDEASEVIERALQQKLDTQLYHHQLYQIAFIHGDTAAMQRQIEWMAEKAGEYGALDWQAQAAAFAGRRRQAREFHRRAIELAARRNLKEVAARFAALDAAWDAQSDQCQQTRADTARALALARDWFTVTVSAFALARCEPDRALLLADELARRFPQSTPVKAIWLPQLRAEIELERGHAAQALQLLEPVSRYEAATALGLASRRGAAYLKLNQGTAAAAEFQKVLDHRGWAPLSPLYPLAHLGLARAAALSGDAAKARRSYQDFFALWKDADADLPILIEAKKEYEKLR